MIYRIHNKEMVAALFLVAALLSACAVQPIASDPAAQPAQPAPDDPMQSTVEKLRIHLAAMLQVAPDAVTVVSSEAVEWPDSCLGAGGPAESCALVVTPGYRIVYEVGGEQYTYHTTVGPSWMRLVDAPAPIVGEPIITWTGIADNGSCQEALIGRGGVAFGYCGLAKLSGKFVSTARLETLEGYAATYAPFDAQTDFGAITFNGSGTQQATPEEQAQLASWVQLLVMEAASGVSMGGLRYDGPAEIGGNDTSKCAALTMSSGEATLFDCAGNVQTVKLNGGYLTRWMAIQDRFAPFVLETETETLNFTGMGAESSEAWQRALLAWARTQYAELSTGTTSAAGNTVLAWNLGPTDDTESSCMHLSVLAWGEAYAETRPCSGGDVQSIVTGWLERAELEELDAWLTEFAPFNAEQGYVAGAGAQQAGAEQLAEVEQWAARVWQRLASDTATAPAQQGNQVTAAGNTVLAWGLGPTDDMETSCMHLTVLASGDAYAETRPCTGGDVQSIVVGTLDAAEQGQLADWLTNYAALNAEQGYVGGTGVQQPGAEEFAAVELWAANVWRRIWDSGEPQQASRPADPVERCPTPTANQQLFVDRGSGFCLLYPADYVAEITGDGVVNLVLGSIMNHVDPRAGIEVTDAAGRSLAEIGDQMMADYAVGFDVVPSSMRVGGAEALVLDNLPGQDLNRRVLVVHDGRLYSFFFTPLGDTDEERAAMDAFYSSVLDSFLFLGDTDSAEPAPKPADNDAAG